MREIEKGAFFIKVGEMASSDAEAAVGSSAGGTAETATAIVYCSSSQVVVLRSYRALTARRARTYFNNIAWALGFAQREQHWGNACSAPGPPGAAPDPTVH